MKLRVAILITASCVVAGFAGAQRPSPSAPPTAAATGAPYTEHSVWDITLVKAKAGLNDDYLRSIAQTFKGTMEEEKKQGLIMDYKVLIGDSSNREDFNILLMVEYKNMAAFDGLREKTDPIMTKVLGGQDAQRQLAVKRLDVREILGTKTMRSHTEVDLPRTIQGGSVAPRSMHCGFAAIICHRARGLLNPLARSES